MSELCDFPLSATTPLAYLPPDVRSIYWNNNYKWLAYLTTKDNYVFLAMRLGAACTTLLRSAKVEEATKIGQFAVNLLGPGMFLTGLEHYLAQSEVGDDLISVKYCLQDVIEDVQLHLDPKIKTELGTALCQIAQACDLAYNYNEKPAVVPMTEVEMEMEIPEFAVESEPESEVESDGEMGWFEVENDDKGNVTYEG